MKVGPIINRIMSLLRRTPKLLAQVSKLAVSPLPKSADHGSRKGRHAFGRSAGCETRSTAGLEMGAGFLQRLFPTALIALVAAAALAGTALVAGAEPGEEPKIQVQRAPVPRENRPALSFAAVVKKVAPSVVTIYSTKTVRENQHNSMLEDPFFRRFFGLEEENGSNNRRPRARHEQSL